MDVRGRPDRRAPKTITLSSDEVTDAIRMRPGHHPQRQDSVGADLSELASDVIDKGMVMTGGAMLRHLDKPLMWETEFLPTWPINLIPACYRRQSPEHFHIFKRSLLPFEGDDARPAKR